MWSFLHAQLQWACWGIISLLSIAISRSSGSDNPSWTKTNVHPNTALCVLSQLCSSYCWWTEHSFEVPLKDQRCWGERLSEQPVAGWQTHLKSSQAASVALARKSAWQPCRNGCSEVLAGQEAVLCFFQSVLQEFAQVAGAHAVTQGGVSGWDDTLISWVRKSPFHLLFLPLFRSPRFANRSFATYKIN